MENQTKQILLPHYVVGEHTYENVIAVVGHAEGEMWFYEENKYLNIVFTEDTVFITQQTYDQKITEISQLKTVECVLSQLIDSGVISSFHIPALYSHGINALPVISKLHIQND
jgi:hypothetical protein